MNALNVFVIHSPRLKFRENNVKVTLNILREACSMKNMICNVNYITNNEIDDLKLQVSDIEKIINYDHTGNPTFDSFIKKLNLEQLSNFLKHKEALNKIKECKDKNSYYMIIEDDAFILQHFSNNLIKLLENIENNNWDMLLLSLASNIDDNLTFSNVKDTFSIIPSKECYMIKKTAAKSLYDSMNTIKFSYRIHLSHWITSTTLSVKYFHPRVFIEGSKVGFVPSTTTENNFLIYNKEFMEIFNMVSGKTEYDFKRIKEVYKMVEHMKSPEIMHLYGVALHRENKISHAYDMFIEAVDIMIEKNGLITPKSELLNNSINIQGMHQIDLKHLESKQSKYKKMNFA